MPLTMRPTGLGSGFYKDKVDYGIYCGEWCIGRIYETRTGPAELRWFWALHAPSKPGSMRISNQVARLEIAKAEFEASWERWKAWAGLEEPTPIHELNRRRERGLPPAFVIVTQPRLTAGLFLYRLLTVGERR